MKNTSFPAWLRRNWVSLLVLLAAALLFAPSACRCGSLRQMSPSPGTMPNMKRAAWSAS